MDRLLMFCGDVHGYITALVNRLCCEMQLEHVDCIVCGDFGIGFDKSWENLYNKIEPKLKKADVHIWVVRGNHDNPEYFEDETKYSKDYVTFMEDYKLYKIAGKEILPIGGATSVDKKLREEGKNWWPGEKIKRVDIKTLPTKVDVIVSHQCPLIFDPITVKLDDDDDIYEEVTEERNYLNEIAFNVKAEYWYYGHHHTHYSGEYKDMKWICLGISNRRDLRPELDDYKEREEFEPNPQGEDSNP